MKTQITFWLLAIFLMLNSTLDAQVSGKYGTEKDKGDISSIDELDIEITSFNTSRLEDIMELGNYQKMLQLAIENNSIEEMKVFKKEALNIMLIEIARAKKNLKELKAGDTKHLEEWQEENAPNYKIYMDQEIRSLTNRINYEVQVYKSLKNKDLSMPLTGRDKNLPIGYISGFKRAMERNLRYESDEKTYTPPKGSGEKKDGNTTTGPVIITKKGSKEKIEEGDSRLNSWIQSKDQRKEDFAKNKADFQKYASNSDDNMARRSYQSIIQLMMNEINSSNWLIGQVGMGNINKGSFDTNTLANTVQKQQTILKEAQTIKVSTPEDLKANKTKALDLISQFSNTL